MRTYEVLQMHTPSPTTDLRELKRLFLCSLYGKNIIFLNSIRASYTANFPAYATRSVHRVLLYVCGGLIVLALHVFIYIYIY